MINKKIVITGANRGFGLALSKHFLALGADCLFVIRKPEAINKVSQQLSGKFKFAISDLSCRSQLENLVIEIAEFKPDILINNAAILGPVAKSWQVDWQSYQNTMQINALSPIRLSQIVIPHMLKKSFGRIINLSGGGAASRRPFYNAYATSKAALNKFGETIAAELENTGITVNSIAPGMMNTQMLSECYQYSKELNLEDEQKKIEQKRASDEAFIALELCQFLCDKSSSHINGKLISAEWDNWQDLASLNNLNDDLYTLRRINDELLS